MRKRSNEPLTGYRVMVVDDEAGIVDSLSVVLKKAGYCFEGYTDAFAAIEALKAGRFDILVLDFLLESIHGDEVVKKIREFDTDLYILLLTGHKDMAPPLETIRALDIQGYCEKNDRFDQLILLIESAIKTIAQRKTIWQFKDGLNRMLESLPKIYKLQPINNILEDILNEAMLFSKSQNGFIFIDNMINPENIKAENNSMYRGAGIYNLDIEEFMSLLSPEFIGNIGNSRLNKETVLLDNGIILPLLNSYQNTMGVLYIENDKLHDDVKLLEIFTNQSSAALNNSILHLLVNTKNEELIRTYNELRSRYLDTIEMLRLAVDAKDVYTRGHSERVAFYAQEIGRSFRVSDKELELLEIGGIFHDVGKIGTADDILLKNDKLNDMEYQEIKKHPIKGAHILSAVSMFKDVVPLVRYHHERIDGRGYPDGLKGDEIPFLARILTVADAFDAMISDRLYRTRLNMDEARKQLIMGAGTQFDADIVEKFIELLDLKFDKMQNNIATTYKSLTSEVCDGYDLCKESLVNRL